MGFVVDQDKTKYMVNDRRTRDTPDLIVGNYTFQGVTEFKYLETNINNRNNVHNEIKLRISTAKRYFALEKL